MSRSLKDKSVTKDKLIGMKVISAEGKLLGTVKDVGFTVGKASISLSVEDIDGEVQEISWDSIQGAVDFVVLKASQAAAEYSSVPQTLHQAQPMQQVQHAQPVQQPQYAQPVQTAQPMPVAQPVQQSQPQCPNCRGPLTYIPQYKRWYCYSCKKYA